MDTNDTMQQNRRGFLQEGAAATTLALAGLPSAARGTSQATGKMKIENVGVMSPGDMGQAVAIQIKAKGLNVYTALEHRSERTRGLARDTLRLQAHSLEDSAGCHARTSAHRRQQCRPARQA